MVNPRDNGILIGTKAICQYAGGISEATLWRRRQTQGFPARKLGGELVSSRKLIDQWAELVALGATVDEIEAHFHSELAALVGQPKRRRRARTGTGG
ncbi:hypothetical protein [Deferrisoma camini]|uniref:hypothetical protein n=1 Tax=Deferrisoma camini TaxID=1035120 RepID=UPI00046C91B9|nr:hypothetical protein [Deferrisoma camini]